MDTLLNNILAIGYLLVWVATFVVYHYRVRQLDAGSMIIGMYIVYGVFSVQSLNDEIFASYYEPLHLFPYIYLYGMMMIAMAPIWRQHYATEVNRIASPNSRVILVLSCLIFLFALATLPSLLGNFKTGIINLFLDADAGKDAYMTMREGAEDSGRRISNLPSVLYNATSEIAIFLMFFMLTKKRRNYWLIAALLFSVIVGLLVPITRGQRTGVINGLLTLAACYFLFRKFIANGLRRRIEKVGAFIIALIMLPVGALTFSRFSTRLGGVGSYLSWYIGQGSLYFNNYGLDAGGIRYGDRTINLLKRVIWPDTPVNYVERREKYSYLEIDDYYFTTFVGDFCLDFGPYLAFLIFVVFTLWAWRKLHTNNDNIQLHQMLLLFFIMCVNIQGGMYLFSFSDSGGLKILAMGMLYIYLRLHERLLIIYPIKTKIYE